MSATRPITVLIAALGGEGGGVLTDWIVHAATLTGFPVQSTSIPGVAQRTGATTYYIEILPMTTSELGGKQPVFALTPGIGDIDLAVASELLEAGRTVGSGFVTPDRTTVIASTSRHYAMDEKTAMGDGRLDPDKLIDAVKKNARNVVLLDIAALAQQSGAMINAVLLGAIAASGQLPIAIETFEAAIRGDGKAADSNLRGFRVGLEVSRRARQPEAQINTKRHASSAAAALEDEVVKSIPLSARSIVLEGVRRLCAYQNPEYARLYLQRLDPFMGGDEHLLAETARHLAVRMSYEDVIRVAEAKIAPKRLQRIAQDELRANGEPFSVHDFLKPGIEEMCQILPPFIARPILRVAERKGWLGRLYFGMEINTTSVLGYLRFLMLAKLKPLRPRGYRFPIEQQQIESWLALINEAAKVLPTIALEVAECARLIKGYGDTHARGSANYRTIVERVIRPALAGHIPQERAADAIASARTAALVDAEGESLAKCLDALNGPELRIAAE
jgi:indolepyruvate ferredoxin oxidoreductase beta subunit